MLTNSRRSPRHRIIDDKLKQKLQYIKDVKSQMKYIDLTLRNIEKEDKRLIEIMTFLFERS